MPDRVCLSTAYLLLGLAKVLRHPEHLVHDSILIACGVCLRLRGGPKLVDFVQITIVVGARFSLGLVEPGCEWLIEFGITTQLRRISIA